MYFFQIKILLFYVTVIFINFYNVFALNSVKIFSVLNSRLPGFRWRAQSCIVLEYNNENMRFIRLPLLVNQIVYISRSNDKKYLVSLYVKTPLVRMHSKLHF